MAITALETIKSWFVKGAKPTEAQFSSAFDSFVHKYDKLQIDSVAGLSASLREKVSTNMLYREEKVTDRTATLEPNVLYDFGVVSSSLWLYMYNQVLDPSKTNEFKVRFTVSGDDFQLKVSAASIVWATEPEWHNGSTYEISILDRYAVFTEFKTKPE